MLSIDNYINSSSYKAYENTYNLLGKLLNKNKLVIKSSNDYNIWKYIMTGNYDDYYDNEIAT